MSNKTRDRSRTEQKILDAVGRIVKEKDFDALGINAVAEEAGVGKVLIYRYFGSLDGLVREWALRSHYWMSLQSDDMTDIADLPFPEVKGAADEIFRNQMETMMEDPLMRKIIRWHLSSGHPVSKEIMAQVEERGKELMESFKSRCATDLDLDVLISLLIGGVYYLTVLSDQAEVFNGIPLNNEEGRSRLKDGISQFIDLVFRDVRDPEV